MLFNIDGKIHYFDWAIVNSWLVVWNMIFFPNILGMSSSQLTHIFQRDRSTTNQIANIFGHPLMVAQKKPVSYYHRGRDDRGAIKLSGW